LRGDEPPQPVEVAAYLDGVVTDVIPKEGVVVETASPMRVEVSTGPATTPVSFGSISPFGARRRDNTFLWHLLIAAIGLLALALVVFVAWKLFL
jgi:hypothetical protein